jgi:uncharacterized RDD family membrane protein YckC
MTDVGDRLETPERVDLEINYAEVGSRALAHIIDLLIVFLGWGIIAIGLWILFPVSGVWKAVLLFAISFLVFWFYFAVFEFTWQGQTPGKRALGIRVQKLGGYPIGWTEALLRNLLRPVDSLVGYAVGLAVMLLTSRSQRVGDLVAGTVVVHEAAGGAVELENIGYAAASAPRDGAPELATKEFEVLHEFLRRRGRFDPVSASRIQSSLAATLRERLSARAALDSRWDGLSDEAFLLHLDAACRGEETWLGPMASTPAGRNLDGET